MRVAVYQADLDLLICDVQPGGACSSITVAHALLMAPGSPEAPAEINKAFSTLLRLGYRIARPARTVHWKKTDTSYWIQWAIGGENALLWAYDPVAKKPVEVLRVRTY